MSKIKILAITFLFVILSNTVLGASYLYNINKDGNKENNIMENNNVNTKDESSISTVANSPEFNFQSQSQILMEPVSGSIIYENNADERLIPASVTKVMTLLLIMEQIDSGKLAYTDKVKCSTKASKMGGSQIWFKENEELTIDEALKAICVVSANDVTVAMAEKIGGTEENFVKMMNDKAKELGMQNTNFMNCHGIDEENHYTCARDIAIMSRELIIKHPDILKYTSIWQDSLRNGEFGLNSTNKLIRYYEGATGLKTGYTSTALYNLSATATRNGTTFLSVVMKAPSSNIRLEETKQLLDYAFSNYENKVLCTENTVIENFKIDKNVTDYAEVIVKDTVSTLIEKGIKNETVENITYNENITAPLKKGDEVGKIEIFDKETNEKLGESKLIVTNEINKSTLIDYLKETFLCFLINNKSIV